MEREKKEALKTGIKAGVFLSIIYALAITVIAQYYPYAYYALCGIPVIFVLTYFFCYALKRDVIKFLTPDMLYNAYDNPVDNLFRSQFSKIVGSIVLPVICFLPTVLFYFLFSWIFLLAKR